MVSNFFLHPTCAVRRNASYLAYNCVAPRIGLRYCFPAPRGSPITRQNPMVGTGSLFSPPLKEDALGRSDGGTKHLPVTKWIIRHKGMRNWNLRGQLTSIARRSDMRPAMNRIIFSHFDSLNTIGITRIWVRTISRYGDFTPTRRRREEENIDDARPSTATATRAEKKPNKPAAQRSAEAREAEAIHTARVYDCGESICLWKCQDDADPHQGRDPENGFGESPIELAKRGRDISHK